MFFISTWLSDLILHFCLCFQFHFVFLLFAMFFGLSILMLFYVVNFISSVFNASGFVSLFFLPYFYAVKMYHFFMLLVSFWVLLLLMIWFTLCSTFSSSLLCILFLVIVYSLFLLILLISIWFSFDAIECISTRFLGAVLVSFFTPT